MQPSKKITYQSKNIKYAHLIRGSTCSIFGSISIDLVPIELKAARANSQRKYNLLVCLCLLTHCLEIFVCANITEELVLLKLLILQQRYNPIFNIITDNGSQLRNLDQTGRHLITGEPLRILALLRQATNAAVYNQRANLVEGHIKKLKLAIKTLGSAGFQGNCRELRPDEFELVLEYVKASIELTPFDKTKGTLCARDFRGASLVAPIELVNDPDKSKLFRTCMVPMVNAVKEAIKTIQQSPFHTNSFYYNVLKKDSRSDPRVRDVCLVLDKSLGDNTRFGIIVKVNRTSVTVRFPDGHQQDYSNESVVLLVRPPKENIDELE